MEYLMVSVFAMVIVIVLFSASLATTSQNISTQQAGESLDNLVQTINLVYAMGPGNVQFAEVSWPGEVTGISIYSLCKTNAEMIGCDGAQGANCNCSGAGKQCSNGDDCIKSSAVKVIEISGNELLYPTKARLIIPDGTDTAILINNFRYKIKVSWTDRKLIRLEK